MTKEQQLQFFAEQSLSCMKYLQTNFTLPPKACKVLQELHELYEQIETSGPVTSSHGARGLKTTQPN
jgi:iron-sulfur cluster repair protein YtfE (RIC family)